MVAAYQSFAHNSATLGNPCTVTKPTGTVNGDLLLAFVANLNSGTAFTAPAGWTLAAGATTTDAIYSKVASSEGANYTWTPGALAGLKVVIVRINGQASSSPVADPKVLAYGNRTNFVLPTLTSPSANCLLLQVVGTNTASISFTPPGTATERFDTGDGAGNIAAGGDETVGSGATGTRTWVASSAANGAGFMLAIAPAAVNATVTVPAAATSTAAAQVPAVTGGATVTGVAATATALALVPSVSGVQNRTVSPPAATSTAAANPPRFTRAPVLVGGSAQNGTSTSTSAPVPKPLGVKLGDLLVVYFVMSGLPTLPPGWAIAYSGDGINVALYARVDGTDITAADDAQTWTFGDGGGAAYYTQIIAAVRYARPVANPFDGAVLNGLNFAGGTTTTAHSMTTTHDDELLMLAEGVLFSGFPTIAAATSPLAVLDATANVSHIAFGEQTTAGTTGSQYLTYGSSTVWNFSAFAAIRPNVIENATVNAVPATATAAAQAPAVTGGANVAAATATATAQAHAPTVTGSATAAGVPATATATALAPAVTTSAAIDAPTATATATAQAPTVAGTQNATISSVTAPATATALAPTVEATDSETIDAVTATASAQAHAPTVDATRNPTTNATTATATAQPVAPAVIGQQNVSVTAVAATATAQALAPTTTAAVNATVAAEPATATCSAHPPTLSWGSAVTCPVATATAQAHSPRVNYNPRQHRATIVDRSRTHTIADVSRTHAISDKSRTTTIREA